MVVSLENVTILISWFSICIPLIILSVLMKLASTTVTVMYSSMNSRHPWRTRIIVKGSDRRPFILILDSISVYHVNQISLYIQTYAKQKRRNQVQGPFSYYVRINWEIFDPPPPLPPCLHLFAFQTPLSPLANILFSVLAQNPLPSLLTHLLSRGAYSSNNMRYLFIKGKYHKLCFD